MTDGVTNPVQLNEPRPAKLIFNQVTRSCNPQLLEELPNLIALAPHLTGYKSDKLTQP
jgi:hypothetical protein